MMDGEFDGEDYERIRDVVARLGVSDVSALGLTWEDARSMLETLGYRPKLAFNLYNRTIPVFFLQIARSNERAIFVCLSSGCWLCR